MRHSSRVELSIARYRRQHPTLVESFLSVQHPEYAGLERLFIYIAVLGPPGVRRRRTASRRSATGDVQQSAIPKLRAHLEAARARPTEIAPILWLLDELGTSALREDKWERRLALLPRRREEHAVLRSIRHLLWERIDEWRALARRSPYRRERAAAVTRLRKVTGALIPDTRGRGSVHGLAQWTIVKTYGEFLFRLIRAVRLAQEWPPPATLEKRARLACEASGLPSREAVPYLLEVLGPHPMSARSLEETARLWTADEFEMTGKTVSNIVASYRRLARIPE